jgi:hypothetical protein
LAAAVVAVFIAQLPAQRLLALAVLAGLLPVVVVAAMVLIALLTLGLAALVALDIAAFIAGRGLGHAFCNY